MTKSTNFSKQFYFYLFPMVCLYLFWSNFRLIQDLFGTEIWWRSLSRIRLEFIQIQNENIIFTFSLCQNYVQEFWLKSSSMQFNLLFLIPIWCSSLFLQLDGFIIPLLQGNILNIGCLNPLVSLNLFISACIINFVITEYD